MLPRVFTFLKNKKQTAGDDLVTQFRDTKIHGSVKFTIFSEKFSLNCP